MKKKVIKPFIFSFLVLLLVSLLYTAVKTSDSDTPVESANVIEETNTTIKKEPVIDATEEIISEPVPDDEPQESTTEEKTPESEPVREEPVLRSFFAIKPDMLPETAIRDFVPIYQFPDFPTGCESVSAVSVLNYFGYDISVDEFVEDYLDKSMNFYSNNGKYYGPDPDKFFVGDPKTTAAYGCMAGTIYNALAKIVGENALFLDNSLTLEELSKTYIDEGIPVIIWASIHMVSFTDGPSWYLEDGTLFTWPLNEHCMVLIGYDDNYFYFADPYDGGFSRYSKAISEIRFEYLNKQSIAVFP